MFKNDKNSNKQQFETYLYSSDRKRLVKLVTDMAEMAQAALRDITAAIRTNNIKTAASVIYGDDAIDVCEEEIDQESLYSIAMRQPLHSDLRFVYGVMKLITDIERIGDQCVNMARLLIKLDDFNSRLRDDHADTFVKYAQECSEMFEALAAAFAGDRPEIADETRQKWKLLRTEINMTIDQMMQEVFSPSNAAAASDGVTMIGILMLVHLMRVSDHLMNFAEKLNFIATGVSPMNYKQGFRKGSTMSSIA